MIKKLMCKLFNLVPREKLNQFEIFIENDLTLVQNGEIVFSYTFEEFPLNPKISFGMFEIMYDKKSGKATTGCWRLWDETTSEKERRKIYREFLRLRK